MDLGDLYGLRNNLQRVFVTLRDGHWHGVTELSRVGGQNFGARIRELRTARCGHMRVEYRKTLGGQYRLDLSTVTDTVADQILTGTLPRAARKPRDTPKAIKQEPVEAPNWDEVLDTILGER